MPTSAHTPEKKSQTLRVRERRLSRPALRLVYDVEFGNDEAAVSQPKLLSLLRDYLMRPIENNDVEPKLPLALSYFLLREGGKKCGSLRADSVPSGLDLMIEGLYVLASDGNAVAQKTLVDIATKAANIVRELSATRPDEMADIAADRDEWPATVSDHLDSETRNAAMIKAVKLGGLPRKQRAKISGLQANPEGYRHIRHIYDNRLVDVLIAVRGWARGSKMQQKSKPLEVGSGRMKKVRGAELDWLQKAIDLPELDEGCANQWLEVGWRAIGFLTGDKPQSLPGLAVLGRYKADYRARRLGNTPGVERAGRSEGIKDRLKENFAKHVLQ